ncbi:MAG: class I SAM-dependent methyltransferase, partial [Acetobacteraceae bacterium]|nr:class I SAM-dependent methyltransferase [Acetobacteraceae bacterium]
MQAVLDAILKRFITIGRLRVRWPDGSQSSYSGIDPGPEAALKIADRGTILELIANPALKVGEAYMEGSLVPEGCSIYDILDVLCLNEIGNFGAHPAVALIYAVQKLTRRLRQRNASGRAQRNAAHHYDLNGRLYSLFLDRDRQYSCAYFPRGDETIEEAQAAKKHHIAAKLCLNQPGLTVLDIGCGWGGLALTLAREYGAVVTGITLAAEQLAEARARAQAEGLSDRVTFELQDYRTMNRPFDRIVSVGMFEHVGLGYYGKFFDVVARCLKRDGVALLHTIGRIHGPGSTNAWIAKYIFPGGYVPALSEVVPVVEQSGLITTDIEVLRLHYAMTLRQWRRRFAANRDAIAAVYDERFCRMFEFY